MLSATGRGSVLHTLRDCSVPFNVKTRNVEVRVVPRRLSEAKRHRVVTQIVKYLSEKFDGALVPAAGSGGEYHELLYLCLKASKCCPRNLKLDAKEFGRVLDGWMKELGKFRRTVMLDTHWR